MRRLLAVFLISFTLLTFCSCSKQNSVQGLPNSKDNSQDVNENMHVTDGVSDPQEDSVNEARSFTKDFDGVVLTITTDKSTYSAGEPIVVTASLENNSDKDINLFYFHIPDKDSELEVNIDRLIKEPFSAFYSRPAAEFILPVKQGEKFVRNYKYHAYTGFLQDILESGEITYSPDPDKIAEAGVYNGSCTIRVCDEPNYPQGDITKYSLDFSVTLI